MHSAAKLVREDELLRLLLAGHMLKECAAFLRLHYATVRDYARQPGFLGRLKELSATIYESVDRELQSSKDNITARLEQFSEEALEEMMKLARESTGMLKMKACQDILDRDTRVSRQRKVEATVQNSFLNPLELRHIAMVAREVDRKVEENAAEPPKELPE